MNALRSQLSWTHYRLLMKIEDKAEQQFYMTESVDCSWSTRQLARQINSFYYQRLLVSPDQKMLKAEAERHNQSLKPVDVLKNILRIGLAVLQCSRFSPVASNW